MTLKPIAEITTADEARQIAIDWQSWQANECLGIGVMAGYEGYFTELAAKFPELAEEFRENGII